MTEQYDNLRKAIDVMTAWATDNPDSTDFSIERVLEYVREGGEVDLMKGLISLAGNLLVKLEANTDKSMQWHLQDIARKIADK
jgi:hypothetical protein